MRYTEKRNGKNVIPLRNAVCGIDLPKWCIHKESYIQSFLSGEAVDRLAELETKIENGTLIELPCKVGDTVYCVDRNRSACYDCEHYSSFYGMDEICEKGCAIYPTIEKNKPICDKHFLEIDEIPFTLKWYGYYKDGFNKDWFVTREEAEKRLKELKE